MKVQSVFYIGKDKQINYGRTNDTVSGFCNYFSQDPYLMMSEKTLEEVADSFTIERDDIKDVLVARNILNGKNYSGEIYAGKYKVFIDNDLPFGIIDVR